MIDSNAALLIGGDTIDGHFKISMDSKKNSPKPRREVSDCRFIIVDEISMVSREKLHNMHEKLGYHLGSNEGNHIFGNKSFLFAGGISL